MEAWKMGICDARVDANLGDVPLFAALPGRKDVAGVAAEFYSNEMLADRKQETLGIP
jgi:hypothetical protein